MEFYIYKKIEADKKSDVVVPEGYKIGEVGVELIHTWDDEIIIPNWFNREHLESITGSSFKNDDKFYAFKKWIERVEPDAISNNIGEDYHYFIEENPEYAE